MRLLAQLDRAVRDRRIEPGEQGRIMREIAVPTWHMRRDLLGRVSGEDGNAVLRDIISNDADLKSSASETDAD